MRRKLSVVLYLSQIVNINTKVDMNSHNISFRLANINELSLALSLLREAAKWLQSKNTQQWSFWINPPQEKEDWIKEGFENKEFYFVYRNEILLGMFRLLYFDEEYWGETF